MDPRSRPRRSPSDSSGRVVCFSLRVLVLPFWYLDAKGGEFVLGERLLGCFGNLHGTRPSLLLYLVSFCLVLAVIICAGLNILVSNSSGGLWYYSLLVMQCTYHLYLCDCIVCGEDFLLEEIYGYSYSYW